MKDTSVIPRGIYCYDEKGVCPYWYRDIEYEEHVNGWCEYMAKYDWERNLENGNMEWIGKDGITFVTKPNEVPFSLLWDQVKECGINLEDNDAK